MAALADLANYLFGKGPSGDPYLQQAAAERAEVERQRQREQQVFGQQQGLAAYLQMLMTGGGPSVVQSQLMQGLEQQRRQQESASAGVAGPNAGMARYLSATGMADAGAATNQAAAMARVAEQAQTRGQLGATLGQMGQQSLAGSGQAIQSGLGYSGQGAQADMAQSQREVQQEGALLQGLGQGASLYFSRPPGR